MRLRPLVAALFATLLCASVGATQTVPASGTPDQSHTVAPGDTLGEIAERYDVHLTDLLAANHLRRSDTIHEGQTISVPPSSTGLNQVKPEDRAAETKAQIAPAPAREPPRAREKKPAKDKDPPPGAGPETLNVTPASTVYFYRPLGRGRLGLRPVIVYLHGRGSQPALDCQRWAPIARKLGWLVCPSGPEDRGTGRGWQDNWVVGQQIVMASIAALRERFGRRVQLWGNTLIGFSEGAFVAMNIGVREPHVFNRWLILAGSSTYWGGPGLEALGEARQELKRVFLITGADDRVMPMTGDALRRLQAAQVPTRMAVPQDMGHEVLLQRKAGLYQAALVWLEKGKGAPREGDLPAHRRMAAR